MRWLWTAIVILVLCAAGRDAAGREASPTAGRVTVAGMESGCWGGSDVPRGSPYDAIDVVEGARSRHRSAIE
jgi:hypothetical protein